MSENILIYTVEWFISCALVIITDNDGYVALS